MRCNQFPAKSCNNARTQRKNERQGWLERTLNKHRRQMLSHTEARYGQGVTVPCLVVTWF